MCRAGCKTKNHATWGECLRDAGVRTYLASPSKGLDGTAQKKWDNELEMYRRARSEGIQPEGTTLKKVTEAMRKSDEVGAAYGRDFDKADPVPEAV